MLYIGFHGDSKRLGGVLVGVAVGHDDEHGFRLALGDQVVQDLAGPAERRPRILVSPTPMEQVQDRILGFLVITVISCGRIDIQSADHVILRRVVPHLFQVARSRTLRVDIGITARNQDGIHVPRPVAHDEHIGRIQDCDAVHVEGVGVQLRRREVRFQRPDAVGALGHRLGPIPHPGGRHAH